MSKPTLTISASCPRCGGTGVRYAGDTTLAFGKTARCPDCTDGTIRQAVSCAGCKWWGKPYGCPAYKPGDEDRTPMPEFGCLSWEAREGV